MFGQWQPIESAPRDGTRVLVYGKDHTPGGVMRVVAWADHLAESELMNPPAPTHWTALPPPPSLD